MTKPETTLYRSPLAYGVCADVDPRSKAATAILDALEPQITSCSMPDCDGEAVRVGVFELECAGDKPSSEFRGLCERHKQAGMWAADGAWSLER